MRSWLSLPLLFLGSSTGVAALLSLLIDPGPSLTAQVTLSAPLLFGVAAALALLTGNHVRWRSGRQRGSLRFPYPLVMLGLALGEDSVHVPTYLALGLGGIATALLATFVVRSVREPAPCSTV